MHIREFQDETGARQSFLVGNDDGGNAAFVWLGSNGLPVLGAQQITETTVRVVSAYMSPRLADGITLVGTVAEVLDLIAPAPIEEPETPPTEEETVTNDEPTTAES